MSPVNTDQLALAPLGGRAVEIAKGAVIHHESLANCRHRENAEFRVIRIAAQDFPDAPVFLGRQAVLSDLFRSNS